MNDFTLPVIKGYVPLPDRILSMDEYMEFVQFNWDNVIDKEAYSKWKEVIAVDVPFKLK